MREVHSALANYRCAIDELITTESRAAARMLFTGTHRGVLFGIPPTGRVITWAGAAFFTIVQGQITRIWVIGDIEGVKRQLGAGAANSF
jgi:predicted ester cyclase